MLTMLLLVIPLLGILVISFTLSYNIENPKSQLIQKIGLFTSILNLVVSLIIFILFDNNSNQFQFVQECYDLSLFDMYLGLDGLSVYFVLLTTIITPIALLSN